MNPALMLTTIVCALLAPVAASQPQNTPGRAPEVIVPRPATQPPQPQAISGTLRDIFAQIQQQEPIRRAGLKASVIKRAQLTVPIVVIVDDAPSYLLAIRNWEAAVRYPVLWDDGTLEAREDIARFVRAFRPNKVVRIEADGDQRWAGDRDEKQRIIERAYAKALGESLGDWETGLKELSDQGIVSPGIVITDALDSAWPSALALAAGRLQPIAFMVAPNKLPNPLSVDVSDSLERGIEHAAQRTGRSWDSIGDDIDAITLAMNTGTLIKTGGSDRARLATTDRIGRKESMGAGDRWAWCGQMIGSEAKTVYQAMCALFLDLDQAFVWDGYTQEQPWAQYDGTQAARFLEQREMDVELHDQPRYTIQDWKQRGVRPLGDRDAAPGSALLMLMNSKGAAHAFDLPGAYQESGRPGHLPVLDIPAALHIVHSFSLQNPSSRNTVGGRFIERGVYVYAGSVDEPYLNAFIPTPLLARRLAASLAFATAVHFDEGKVWKLTVLGDPLVTVSEPGNRVEGDLQIQGAVDLDEHAKAMLKEGAFERALSALTLLGRDKDAARLAIALMQDKPEAFTPGSALIAVPALFRAGEYVAMLDAYERLDASGRIDGLMQDLLWLASPYLLARGTSDTSLLARVEALLRSNIREGQKIQDAEQLAMHLRQRSLDAALGVLESLRPTLLDHQRTQLDRAIRRVTR